MRERLIRGETTSMDERRDRSLRDSRHALERLAPVVRYSLLAAGIAVAMGQIRPLVADGQFTWGERRVIAAVTLVTLGGFAIAAWIADQLLRVVAGLIGAVAESAEASLRTARLIETRVVPDLARAAAALEGLALGSDAGPEARASAEIRRAIGECRWSRAERLIEAFGHDFPHAAQWPTLSTELREARATESDSLRVRLDEAMADDDAGSVISCRDSLTRHLGGDELHELDLRVVVWVARWVKRRARGGTAEVASVAALAADRFADTEEGRILRDSVPGLRRRAGLCPACARTYRGQGEACPDCLDEQSRRPLTGRLKPRA
jgi:hypothetical protein